MLRLDVAKSLIEEGGLSLTQIAEKLNYATPYSLSKAFKNRFKISPREHKKLYNNTKFNQ
jgi:AraC-like DNA-binding protein